MGLFQEVKTKSEDLEWEWNLNVLHSCGFVNLEVSQGDVCILVWICLCVYVG